MVFALLFQVGNGILHKLHKSHSNPYNGDLLHIIHRLEPHRVALLSSRRPRETHHEDKEDKPETTHDEIVWKNLAILVSQQTWKSTEMGSSPTVEMVSSTTTLNRSNTSSVVPFASITFQLTVLIDWISSRNFSRTVFWKELTS